MKTLRLFSALVVTSVCLALHAQGADKPAGERAKCCAKAAADGKSCEHSCCVDAAKADKNCEGCGGKNEKKT